MATEDVRKVFPKEIQKVQNHIEKCISQYMKKNQVIDILQHMNIEPTFTKLVWEKLEEENKQFFWVYHLSLMVKDQIVQFNDLLERQVAISHQLINPHGVVSNGTDHMPTMHTHNASCYALETNDVAMKPESMQQAFPMVVHADVYNNGEPYIPLEMQHGPLNMTLGQNLNGVAITGTSYDHLANVDATLESHQLTISSSEIMDSIPHYHQFNGVFMDNTRSSQDFFQFSHDINCQPNNFTNTTTADTQDQRFMSSAEPNFSKVMNIPTNCSFQNSGRVV